MSVGPVIGRVTDSVAVVLLEVDQRARITCYASVITPASPAGNVVAQETLELQPNRPRAFFLRGLLPGKKHVVVFSGISREDAESRLGVFTTLSGAEGSLRIVAVSGDKPSGLELGQANPWEQLHSDVDAGKIDVMIHLGSQVRQLL